jgi:hypothetical protein
MSVVAAVPDGPASELFEDKPTGRSDSVSDARWGIHFQYLPKMSRDGPQWAQNAEAIKRPPAAAIEELKRIPAVAYSQIIRYDTLALEQGMTNREYLKRLLEVARSNHGEDAFSMRTLKQQIASMEGAEERRGDVSELATRENVPKKPPPAVQNLRPFPLTASAVISCNHGA